MIRPLRGPEARAGPKARRWPFLVPLLVVASVLASAAWIRSERLQAIAALTSRLALRVGKTEGLLWPTRLTNVALDVSPNLSVAIARVELGLLPWPRAARAHGVVIRAQGPLDTFWEAARRFDVPTELEVVDARVEYVDSSARRLNADGVRFQPGAQKDHVNVQRLHAFGATFRDVHFWVSRPSTVLQLQLTDDAEDSKAPTLNVTRSPGQGVEWTLDIPSQPFPAWAKRVGLSIGDDWSPAVFVAVGALLAPDSPAVRARADFRFTIDNWHRPSWPEAALLTGRSGAVAFRVSPGPDAVHTITRVEVAAGLFSLVGTGQLSLGEPRRLEFDAHGELTCARLLAHLPASAYRERVRQYLDEHPQLPAGEASVRLELAVRAEAARGQPLGFRWHLRTGCGLPEMKED